ncbi:hypothetical protein F4780DRAFT_798216 [Xylariomycetidae sp. FL0641]|nr:hypothetical protein F4780DRAFT_798216 [Xylariomycetidae sp. FL0641]
MFPSLSSVKSERMHRSISHSHVVQFASSPMSQIASVIHPIATPSLAVAFMEIHGDESIGVVPGFRFDQAAGKFMLEGHSSNDDYFQESYQRMNGVKVQLQNLGNSLRSKKGIRDLNIIIKEPHQFTPKDAVDIAQRVQNAHERLDTAGRCNKYLRTCARWIGDNASGLEKFLKFIPDSPYSSIVYGTFGMVLAAAAVLSTARENLYQALQRIPDDMENIICSVTINSWSCELLKSANDVYSSMFIVLEDIIDSLLKSPARKFASAAVKGHGYSRQLDQDLLAFGEQLDVFRRKAAFCDSMKIDVGTKGILKLKADEKAHHEAMKAEISNVHEEVKRMRNSIPRFEEVDQCMHRLRHQITPSYGDAIQFGMEHIRGIITQGDTGLPETGGQAQESEGEEKTAIITDTATLERKVRSIILEDRAAQHHLMSRAVLEATLCLVQSSPIYDRRTGYVDTYELDHRYNPNYRPWNASPHNQQGSGWTAHSYHVQDIHGMTPYQPSDQLNPHYPPGPHNPTLAEQAREATAYLADATLLQQDQIQHIFSDPSFHFWLRYDRSSILLLHAEHPSEAEATISCATGILTQGLLATAAPRSRVMVLGWFGGSIPAAARRRSSGDGIGAAVHALVEQLLSHLRRRGIPHRVPPPPPAAARLLHAPHAAALAYALDAFRGLVARLPPGFAVFLVVDNVARLECGGGGGGRGESATRDALGELLQVTDGYHDGGGAVVKALVTQPLRFTVPENLKGRAHEVYLGSHVDGGRSGINVEFALREVAGAVT